MPAAIDTSLFLWINGDWGCFFDSFFWIMSGKLTWAPLYALIIWVMYRRFGLRATSLLVLGAVVAVVFSDQVARLFKHHFDIGSLHYTPRLRPTHTPELAGLVHTVNDYKGGLYGTVSAHAATTAAMCVYFCLILRRRVWYALLPVWVLLVIVSRIYLGVHYPLDIFYGLLLGVAVGLGLYYAFARRVVGGAAAKSADL